MKKMLHLLQEPRQKTGFNLYYWKKELRKQKDRNNTNKDLLKLNTLMKKENEHHY